MRPLELPNSSLVSLFRCFRVEWFRLEKLFFSKWKTIDQETQCLLQSCTEKGTRVLFYHSQSSPFKGFMQPLNEYRLTVFKTQSLD